MFVDLKGSGSWSGSIINCTCPDPSGKKILNNHDFYCFVTSHMLSLKINVNESTIRNKQKSRKKSFFVAILKAIANKSMIWGWIHIWIRTRIRNPVYGFKHSDLDPDLNKNFMNPEHWFLKLLTLFRILSLNICWISQWSLQVSLIFFP